MEKPKTITTYEKLSEALKEEIRLFYPYGFSDDLITITNTEGKRVQALRYETDEKIYLIKMTKEEMNKIGTSYDFDDEDSYEDYHKNSYSDDDDDAELLEENALEYA